MSMDLLLNGPVGTTLGWTLIHLLWQATAVALILGAVRTLWSGASPNARYGAAIAALLAVLILPALTFSHLWQEIGQAASALPDVPVVAHAGAEAVVLTPEPFVAGTGLETSISVALPWFVGLWMLGVAFLGLRLFVRTAWTARLTREQLTEVEGSWHRALARLCRKLDLRKAIALYESALVEVPTVVGWFRPVILVPTSVFTGLTYRQIEMILAHELAHVRRHDAVVNFLQSIVETLFFFHPAIWWISGRIRIDREHCCDDVALSICGDRVAYAKALTFLEEMRAVPPVNALAANGGSLLERIRRIAGVEERDRKAPSIAALVLLLTLGGATAWALSAPRQETAAVDFAEHAGVEVVEEPYWYAGHPAPPLPPDAPAPPDAPPAPPAPLDGNSWMIGVSDFDFMMETFAVPPVAPAPPTPPAPSMVGTTFRSVAPRAPQPPDAPRIAAVAPRADGSYVVRGKRLDEPDRKITEDLSVDDLIVLRSVDVKPEYLRELRDLGLDDLTVGEAVAMRSVGVSPSYVKGMKQVFGGDVTPGELTRLKAVGVSVEWVEAIRQGTGKRLSIEDAIRLRGVGVTPEWIGTMSRVIGEDLTLEDAIRLRGVGVSELYIQELVDRGIPMPPTEALVRLRGVGVTAEFIDRMKEAGILSSSIDDLVRLRGVGVSPEYISELRRAGLPTLDIDTLVGLRGVGVTSEYVDEIKRAGYGSIDAQSLMRLRGVGVTADYVTDMRDAGFPVSSASELIRLRGAGVTPEYVESLREAGVEDVTADKLIRLRASGIDADFIRDMRN